MGLKREVCNGSSKEGFSELEFGFHDFHSGFHFFVGFKFSGRNDSQNRYTRPGRFQGFQSDWVRGWEGLVRIKNVETGAILAQGIQEGGTGDTERIMVQPRRRGEMIYGTAGAAYFQADLALAIPRKSKFTQKPP